MNTVKVVIHWSSLPGVVITSGAKYYLRTRWATDRAALAEPPTTPRTAANFSDGGTVFIASASSSNPFVWYVNQLWWWLIRSSQRNLYCIVEWQDESQTAPWAYLSDYDFVINHDPVADGGPDQVIVLDDQSRVVNDVTLDASRSDDPDLHAGTNPDPGPLHYAWQRADLPVQLDLNGDAFMGITSLEHQAQAKPLFLQSGALVPPGDRGMYSFSLDVTDNDVASVGDLMGTAGINSTVSRVLIVGGALADIYVDCFIPDPVIDNPLPVVSPPDIRWYYAFKGDGRIDAGGDAIFEKGGSARMWSSVVVSLGDATPMLYQQHDTGWTEGYYNILSHNKIIGKSDKDKASTSKMYEEAFQQIDSVRVHIFRESVKPANQPGAQFFI